jgi:hypothetical protein
MSAPRPPIAPYALATERRRDVGIDRRRYPASILHAKRWELLEVSMVEKPAGKFAIARPTNHEVRRIRRRTQARAEVSANLAAIRELEALRRWQHR